MSNEIHFTARLEIDSSTVPLAELHIVQNEKHIQDAITLLSEPDIGKGDKEQANGAYIAETLGNEWRFYYATSENLAKLKVFLDNCDLVKQDNQAVSERIDRLQETTERWPKTLRWKLRAKVGTSTKWYNAVEEVQRD
jgi:hypothetical protein